MKLSPLLDAAAALSTVMDIGTGRTGTSTENARYRLSDMVNYFVDEPARSEAQEAENRTVYEMHTTEPDGPGQFGTLAYTSTVVHPGTIGGEFFMTRGHAHNDPDATEIYLTVRGEGMMFLQSEDFQVQALAMAPGTVLYVPGTAMHRIVNVGEEPLVTFSVFPAAGTEHFSPATRSTFKRIVVTTPEGPDLAVNPNFTGQIA